MRTFPGSSAAIFVIGVLIVSCGPPDPHSRYAEIVLPETRKNPVELTLHGHTRVDDYFWMNDRDNPDVISYIEAENEYLNTVLSHTKGLQDKLFEEMRSRIKEDDSSVPYKLGEYYYYSRYEEGKEYAIFCRRKGTMEAAEEIIVDGNKLGEGKAYFALGSPVMSTDHSIAVFAVDTVGRRFYTVMFKDMKSGEILPYRIPNITGNIVWANDNKTVFYAAQHPTTLRPYKIYRYELGTPVSRAVEVYEEKDETFFCYLIKTKSDAYVMIYIGSTLSTEIHVLDANSPRGRFTIVQPRERELEYTVSHYGDKFYIRTNLNAPNFKLVEVPVSNPGKEYWKDILPHRENTLLERVEIFRDYLVVEERTEGLPGIRIRPWSGEGEHYLDFGEPAYAAYLSINPEYETDLVRYTYSSLTTPSSIFDYNMVTGEKILLKQQPVLGNFDPVSYVTERAFATAADGARIPISLVYKKGLRKNGRNPALIYGYGAYGYSMEPTFSSVRLSLLDRGFVFAIAHIRGGEEMGRRWYEEGKMLNKKNTFTDFVACSEELIRQRYTSQEKLFAMGGSAGGLLIGVVANMRPELYRGVIASVPFVDVVTTMLDDSIPLTTAEYDEWGNPNIKEQYDYLLSYSPYDNVEERAYPNMLVTSGLHDSQVQYWEPTKWVAKLRDRKTDDNLLVLYTNMDAGHGGASGRFQALREVALEYAFMLDLLGIDK